MREELDYISHIPSWAPSDNEWEQRRRIYDSIWSDCINENGSLTNSHAGNLNVELERCYCSGAWVACIILAAAMAEVHLSYLNKWKNNQYLEELGIDDKWEWLKKKRNDLIHGSRSTSDNRLPTEKYQTVQGRKELEMDARKAIFVALKIKLNNPPE
ncbi:hypothetical protein ACVW8L_004554 [Vibrio parahaemolyticus]|uniref:hypothetical protein n=1 Tax=Vibrio coralliilyticus TaxID=190893 RepID=UPI00036A9E7C|nr:hypothetical protein [Vibrio coralliilyticus]ELI5882865.1 hypothetical protein [Vibrio parahaemolyticus]